VERRIPEALSTSRGKTGKGQRSRGKAAGKT
jgi:hypothetical protein